MTMTIKHNIINCILTIILIYSITLGLIPFIPVQIESNAAVKSFSESGFTSNSNVSDRIIVSLGDSYSSGEGMPPFYDCATEKDPHRSKDAWSGQLYLTADPMADPTDQDTEKIYMNQNRFCDYDCDNKDDSGVIDRNWYFVASSGATTSNIKNSQGDIPPQINIFDRLKQDSKTADYITITIGGNDVKFSEIIKKAVFQGTIFGYLDLYFMIEDLKSEFKPTSWSNDSQTYIRDKIYQTYIDIYNASISQDPLKTNPHIIVAGYPELLEYSGKGLPFSKYEAELINNAVNWFNDELNYLVWECQSTENIDISFVDVSTEFKNHQAYSEEPWLNELKDIISPSTLTIDVAYAIHPNADGAKAYAKCVQDEINEHEFKKQKQYSNTNESSTNRDVVLVLDSSGSMANEPIEETIKASKKFVDTALSKNTRVGIVSFYSDAIKVADFSTDASFLKSSIDRIYAEGGTYTEGGLQVAYEMLQNSTANKKIIVLMSDGAPNQGLDGENLIAYANEIKDAGIQIYTLGFFEHVEEYSTSFWGDHVSKADAQALMEGIASEGCHFEVVNADDLVFFFDDIANQLSGKNYIYIRIACPVDVTVKYNGEILCSDEDNLSTRASFGSLTFEEVRLDESDGEDNNKDDEEQNGEDKVKILRLVEGVDYDIQINGTGKGTMDYSIGFMDENGEYSDMREFNNIKITKTTAIDTVATRSDVTTLNVDEDGDGKYDLRYQASENGKGKLVDIKDENTALIIIAIVIALAVIGLIIAIIILKKRKKKDNQMAYYAPNNYIK